MFSNQLIKRTSKTASPEEAKIALDAAIEKLRGAFQDLAGADVTGRSVLASQLNEAKDLIGQAARKLSTIKNSLG
jgi:hypothetical protein